MPKDVIIALDFKDSEETLSFLKLFREDKLFVKIGMELFYSEGPDIVKEVKSLGHKVFLDLKLCDIPNTVKGAMRSLSALDADMVNVHALGGSLMMKAALEGLRDDSKKRPLIIAVTMLTSLDDDMVSKELLIDRPLKEAASSYALLSLKSGMDGVVCSPHEARAIHGLCGDDFITVTPGIRFSDSENADQRRVTSPAMARDEGSDYIVVGRPITRANDPVAAYLRCMEDFLGEL